MYMGMSWPVLQVKKSSGCLGPSPCLPASWEGSLSLGEETSLLSLVPYNGDLWEVVSEGC